MPLLVLMLAIAALVISIATAVAVFAILSGIRRQSKKSYEVASRVMEDWEKFSAREADERQRLAERFARFESATGDRVEQFEKVATGTRETHQLVSAGGIAGQSSGQVEPEQPAPLAL